MNKHIIRIASIVAATTLLGALTAAAPVSAATLPRCHSTHLSLHLGQPGEAAGSTYYHLRFTNKGAVPCTLFGYPGVQALSSPAGEGIGHPATRNPQYPSTVVVLAPGGRAHAVLGIGTASDYLRSRCHPRTAGAVGVYPPGAFRRLAARLRFTACAGRKVHLLSVTAVVPGG